MGGVDLSRDGRHVPAGGTHGSHVLRGEPATSRDLFVTVGRRREGSVTRECHQSRWGGIGGGLRRRGRETEIVEMFLAGGRPVTYYSSTALITLLTFDLLIYPGFADLPGICRFTRDLPICF